MRKLLSLGVCLGALLTMGNVYAFGIYQGTASVTVDRSSEVSNGVVNIYDSQNHIIGSLTTSQNGYTSVTFTSGVAKGYLGITPYNASQGRGTNQLYMNSCFDLSQGSYWFPVTIKAVYSTNSEFNSFISSTPPVCGSSATSKSK